MPAAKVVTFVPWSTIYLTKSMSTKEACEKCSKQDILFYKKFSWYLFRSNKNENSEINLLLLLLLLLLYTSLV